MVVSIGDSLSLADRYSELLGKMCIRIPDSKEPIIPDETFNLPDEFCKLRHFKRYYYSFDYDWDHIDYLGKQFLKVCMSYSSDIDLFKEFLNRLQSD